MSSPAQPAVEPGRLFNGIASAYTGPAVFFSYGQYRLWHRYLVSRLKLSPSTRLLDVCTGTGLVAMDVARRGAGQVVGLDLSDGMLDKAHTNITRSHVPNITLVRGRAEQLPFADASFDAVVFTYLLRYVSDPAAVLHELTRVLRPGGQLASLEFYVPQNPLLRSLWMVHSNVWMPLGTRLLSPGWREVGAFLGPNISSFYKKYTLANLSSMWEAAHVAAPHVKTLSFGAAVVMWGKRASEPARA